MADLSDVLTVLAASAVAAIYPNGTGQASPTGAAVKVYAGWPGPAQLDADLRAASPVCHVSIYPSVGERNTTRYSPNDWKQVSVQTPTMTAVLAGQVVTLGGTIPGAGNQHNVVIIANGVPFVCAVLTTDTLATVASYLTALIAAVVPGTVSAGPVITFPSAARVLAARVGVTGTSVRELRRQERRFQFAVWADTPTHRDAIAAVLDWNLAIGAFIALPDGTAGRIRYAGTVLSDALQKDCLFRRDLFYTVEYGTTQTETETQITQTQLNTSAAPSGITPYSATFTVYG